jgi:hypothetical protein
MHLLYLCGVADAPPNLADGVERAYKTSTKRIPYSFVGKT